MLALVVFLNGMAIMVLEMAGARLLAPELGTSILVWTSLIGVILASLSLGYWLGGKLADNCLRTVASAKKRRKDAPPEETAAPDQAPATYARAYAVLSNLLVFASISVFLCAALGLYVPSLVSRLSSSLYVSTVLAALALFTVPSLLCGMVSPYAVRLGITDSETSGAIIGRLNAIGTVGSIVGTFLGGFVLLAWFSTSTILLGVAATLLLASALVRARPLLPKALLFFLLGAGMVGDTLYTDWTAKTGLSQGIPITIETSYSSMRVAKGRQEDRSLLLLLTDPGSAQSGMFEDAPDELLFAYTKFYGLGTGLRPDAKRILMLGGGGYSVPKWLLSGRSDLASPDFTLDVVELDPGMTRVAARYFKAPLDDPRMTVRHEDARTFINRASGAVAEGAYGPYDLIFADIFNSWYTVPFHVGTREAAAAIHRLLAKDGVYVMNIITAVTGDNGRLLRSIRNAFLEVFGEVHIFPVQSKYAGNTVQNVMLLAFREPQPLPDPAKDRISPRLGGLLANAWTAPFPPASQDVPPLRDDFAPVERYTLGYTR